MGISFQILTIYIVTRLNQKIYQNLACPLCLIFFNSSALQLDQILVVFDDKIRSILAFFLL